MIYRIHPSTDKFLCLHIDGKEARKVLGENTDFNIDPSPISYRDQWKTMIVEFYDDDSGTEVVPDISMRVGKLFLSNRAYEVLKNLFDLYGEFLSVIYDGGSGYIFNCLELAEQHKAVNNQLSMHDPLSDKFSIVFDENKLSGIDVFRCEIDLDAFFISEKIKKIIEAEQLTGITFTTDVSHPFPPELNMKTNH